MRILNILILAISWLSGIVLFVGCVQKANAASERKVGVTSEKPNASIPLKIVYEDGLISLRFSDVPLGKVLHEVSRTTEMAVSITDSEIFDTKVSAIINRSPLLQVIKVILNGFSYVIDLHSEPTVFVLSTPPVPTRIEHAKELSELTTRPSPVGMTTPIDDEIADIFDGAMEPIDDIAYNESLLEWALDALNSDNKKLHVEAINQLVGLDDPQAMEALIETATNVDLDAAKRLRVIEALSQHSTIQVHADTVTNALRQLAEDPDDNISRIAIDKLRVESMWSDFNTVTLRKTFMD